MKPLFLGLVLLLVFSDLATGQELTRRRKHSKREGELLRLEAQYRDSLNAPWVTKFEKDIRKFEKEDSVLGHPHYDVVFTGSSTFALWKTLQQDFAPMRAVNRGFGGSKIQEAIHYMDRVVVPYQPRVVVLYVGNDIWGNPGDLPPESVFDLFRLYELALHKRLPKTQLDILGLRPTPIKRKKGLLEKEAWVNEKLKAYARKAPRTRFISFDPVALDKDGRIRGDIVRPDSLHLTDSGNVLLRLYIQPIVQKQLK